MMARDRDLIPRQTIHLRTEPPLRSFASAIILYTNSLIYQKSWKKLNTDLYEVKTASASIFTKYLFFLEVFSFFHHIGWIYYGLRHSFLPFLWSMNMLNAGSFFDLSDFPHTEIFPEEKYVWTGLNVLKEYMDSSSYPLLFTGLIQEGVPLVQTIVLHENKLLDSAQAEIVYGDTTKGGLAVFHNGDQLAGATVIMAGTVLLGKRIKLGKGVLVESGALIKSPAIIGDQTEVRQGAYLRGYCLTGRRCVLGHTTEVKHSIFLNDAKAGHFAYLGDSILGNNVNLGAGTKFANLRFFSGNITIRTKEEGLLDTGRRKFGAILGDDTQTGCNSVTSPGTLIGKNSYLLPNATARSGYHPPRTVIR